MISELPFTGFSELIKDPLESSDERSFLLIQRCLLEEQHTPAKPFSVIIRKLTGHILPGSEALNCWKQILRHKTALQQKLGRTVGIQTAAIDYFEQRSLPAVLFNTPVSQPDHSVSLNVQHTDTLFNQGYHLMKLKEELLRAKRYKHALSIIIVDLDDFTSIQEAVGAADSDKILTTIVNIIRKTIRSVDFLYRLSEDRFFLILPNTNRREATELAERIRVRIRERTARLNLPSERVTATLSVGQYSHADSSIDFVRRVERLIDQRSGKGDAVLSLC